MKYQKPQVIAKNNPKGSFAAGCPANHRTNSQLVSCYDQCDKIL